VFHPEFIGEANLGFAQKLSIARSMSLDEHENAVWELGTKLNSLRNELAHKLDSPKRAARTRAVIDLYFRHSADLPDMRNAKDDVNRAKNRTFGGVTNHSIPFH
jgi:hypothetical protein